MSMRSAPTVTSLLCVACFTALSQEPPDAMQHARSSFELAKRGDLPAAAEEMRVAIRLAPQNPLYLSALGGILARNGKSGEAKQCFEQAVALDSSNPVLRLQLARLQWEAGELAVARENLLRAADGRPGDTEIAKMLEELSLELGASLAKQGRYRAGLVIAKDTARRYPQSAQAQQMLGLFLTRNQENPAAIAAYQKALSLAPGSADLNVGLGVAQTMAGLLPDAARTLKTGIAKWPDDAMHYQAYGVLLLRMAKEGTAAEADGVQALNKALALNPNLPESLYQLGNLALSHGQTDIAIDQLSAALLAGDESSKLHFALARAYRAAGNPVKAEEHARIFRERKQQEQQAGAKK